MRYLYSMIARMFRQPPEPDLVLARLDASGYNPAVRQRSQDEIVFDLEIPANRGDLLSHLGIAREIGVFLDQQPVPLEANVSQATTDSVDVKVENPRDCPYYSCRVVRGVRVEHSPPWLRDLMEKLGMRSTSTVVDLSNLVMAEMGQPLHVFDLSRVRGAVTVRRSVQGEAITTIDGRKRSLPDGALLIADDAGPIALAGIMGGADTEVTDATVDILIEGACFAPHVIRRSSRAVGLATEASVRFERGIEREQARLGLDRLTCLILAESGGKAGPRQETGRPVRRAVSIPFNARRASALLGMSVSKAEAELLFVRMGCGVRRGRGASCTVSPPPHRRDLQEEVDLIEEIARHRTYAEVPALMPSATLMPTPSDPMFSLIERCRDIFCLLGFAETVGLSLISDEATALLHLPAVEIENPLSRAFSHLRPSLLPSLLETVRHNLTRQTGRCAIFEIGTVYPPADSGDPTEEVRAGLCAVQDDGFFLLKGCVTSFCERAGIAPSWKEGTFPLAEPQQCAALVCDGVIVGYCFKVRHDILARYDLPEESVWCAEIRLAALRDRLFSPRRFTEPPAFPAVRRDFSCVFPASVRWEDAESAIRQLNQPIESIEVFDLYRGRQIPDGCVSVSFTIVYRSGHSTLTSREVDEYAAAVLSTLETSCGARVRQA